MCNIFQVSRLKCFYLACVDFIILLFFYSENSIALTSETEDNTFNEELNEPIYVNINSKKQTNPIPLCDLYDVILKYRENGMAGFKTEFDVSLLSGLVV